VVLRPETLTLPASTSAGERTLKVLRVDVVGDPLFRRRLCVPHDLFETPAPVRALRVVAGDASFDVAPDPRGHVFLTGNDDAAADSVLRVVTTPEGVVIEGVGTDAATTGPAR
jgi:streptogramin lyase